MNKSATLKAATILVSFLVALASYSLSLAKEKDSSVLNLQGEIMDSQCAFNVHSTDHSHESMTKNGVYGRDARSCTLHCAKEMGGVFVLVVKDSIYRFDDDTQALQYAGRKVKVSATPVDAKGLTLHVLKIESVH